MAALASRNSVSMVALRAARSWAAWASLIFTASANSFVRRSCSQRDFFSLAAAIMVRSASAFGVKSTW